MNVCGTNTTSHTIRFDVNSGYYRKANIKHLSLLSSEAHTFLQEGGCIHENVVYSISMIGTRNAKPGPLGWHTNALTPDLISVIILFKTNI